MIANERLIEAVADPDRYPEGTTFIAADQEASPRSSPKPLPSTGRSQSSTPDGREIVAAPRGGALAFFEHLLTRRRESKRDQPAMPLPADHRVEIRDRQLAAA